MMGMSSADHGSQSGRLRTLAAVDDGLCLKVTLCGFYACDPAACGAKSCNFRIGQKFNAHSLCALRISLCTVERISVSVFLTEGRAVHAFGVQVGDDFFGLL